MTAVKTYRAAGIIASLAIKAPCIAVTDEAITLSGEQTVNGVAVVEGDRVLVKDQSDSKDNGIYNVSTGAWTRAADFDGNRDVTNGTLVAVVDTPLVGLYQMTATNPVTVGTTALTFTLLSAINVAGNLASTATGKGASLVGLEDADGNYDATDVEAALKELASTKGAGIIGLLDSAGNFTATDVEAAFAELYKTGTFVTAVTGGTSGANTTFTYTIIGKVCTIHNSNQAANIVNSTSTAMTLPNLPDEIQPANTVLVPTYVLDGDTVPLTTYLPAVASISGDTMTFYTGDPLSAAGFTSTGIKGLPVGWSITYPLT